MEEISKNQLEQWQKWLRLLASTQVDPVLADQIDLSGVIQETLMEAAEAMNADSIETKPRDVSPAWLRTVFANNLLDAFRRLRAAKRGLDRQVAFEQALDQSSARISNWLISDSSTPSEKLHEEERAIFLAQLMDSLPESQRQAIYLQCWHGWSLAEIAIHLNRSKPAVAGLIQRGLRQMRESIEKDFEK